MGELRKNGRCRTLVVSGCFSERYRERVKKDFSEVDIWAGVDDWEDVISSVKTDIDTAASRVSSISDSHPHNANPKVNTDIDTAPRVSFISDSHPNNAIPNVKRKTPIIDDNSDTYAPFKRVLSEPLSTQYIKIAEGCSHKCSFCVIPAIRGKFKSRSIDSILQEARWLYDKGVRELILVAQDTSFYGRDCINTGENGRIISAPTYGRNTNSGLTRLLESLLKGTDFPWIRMMYLHPQFVDNELLTLIASEERLCRYFDIPLQHIADPILTAMNRQPLSKGIYELIDRIRNTVDGAALRSSFIIGFPGETEKEFGELTRFVQHARFDKLGVFPFSPEEGTPAYHLRPRPRAATVQKRCDELMAIQQEISRDILEAKIGSRTEIIIDRISDDPDFNYEGRTRNDAPEVDGRVFVQSGNFEIGQILRGTVVGANDYDLYVDI